MSQDRTGGRTVFIYFSTDPGVLKGGLCPAGGCTERDFLDMLDTLCHAQDGFNVQFQSETGFISGRRLLRQGNYTLHPKVSGQQISINNDQYHPRTLSLSDSTRNAAFCQKIRQRDGRCVITGQVNTAAAFNGWSRFQVAHIFPLSLSSGYNALTNSTQPSDINSPRNGILLRADVHGPWDNYSISVNPNTYRVVAFQPDCWDLHGKILHPVCRQPGDSNAVLDALLKWHFEQAVLCNMRGLGEPLYDFDFPPGSDMVGTILKEPQADQRMEAELSNRLYDFST